MKMSPLNKNYFDNSFVDKHDPIHDKKRILHTLISKIWWFLTPKRITRHSPHPFYIFFWSRMCTLSYLTRPRVITIYVIKNWTSMRQ